MLRRRACQRETPTENRLTSFLLAIHCLLFAMPPTKGLCDDGVRSARKLYEVLNFLLICRADLAMETTLPQEWTALCLLVFVLGMRHGFDADHLATIDGLTRFNARSRSVFARWCGVLFSLGHGAVVVTIALLVSLASGSAQVPQWLEGFGTGVSVLFLLALGCANLLAVLRTPASEVVQPVGLKGRFLGRLQQASHPGLIALVGALFALSFDTLSQAALFALTATRYGGWEHALALGLIFMGGMLATDGINGFWIARLLRRADATALIASRVMGLAVAFISLGVAAFALAKWTLPAVDAWSEGKELSFGFAVMTFIALSFFFAVRSRSQAVVVTEGATVSSKP